MVSGGARTGAERAGLVRGWVLVYLYIETAQRGAQSAQDETQRRASDAVRMRSGRRSEKNLGEFEKKC